MNDDIKKCPRCGNENLRTRWGGGTRNLVKACPDDDCDWTSKPYTPPKRPIRTTKTISVDKFGGFVYEMFDQYGHLATSSQTFDTAKACAKEAQNDVNRTSKAPGYGPCTALIWPAKVQVTATVIKPTE